MRQLLNIDLHTDCSKLLQYTGTVFTVTIRFTIRHRQVHPRHFLLHPMIIVLVPASTARAKAASSSRPAPATATCRSVAIHEHTASAATTADIAGQSCSTAASSGSECGEPEYSEKIGERALPASSTIITVTTCRAIGAPGPAGTLLTRSPAAARAARAPIVSRRLSPVGPNQRAEQRGLSGSCGLGAITILV